MPLNDRLTWVLRGVRRWRGQGADDPLPVRPDLESDDVGRLSSEISAVIETRGGLAAARRRARKIGATYETLSPVGQRRFFELLATEHGPSDQAVDRAIQAVLVAADQAERGKAETELRQALRPGREILLQRLAGHEGGLAFLVGLRADLLPHRRESPELAALDIELRQILDTWFDIGLLELVRLTWESPASLLEKLIEYEAVHAIESWDDLKQRLGPGRRCYAFVHPGMPGDPLIFVEVALTEGIPDRLGPLIDLPPPTEAMSVEAGRSEDEADTAVFYSISNCHRGLAGVSLGDFLIKSVAEELAAELDGVKTFVTLSPLPGFRSWLQQVGGAPDGDPPGEHPVAHLLDTEPGPDGDTVPTTEDQVWAALRRVVAGEPGETGPEELQWLRPALSHLAARYVTSSRPDGRALDPVAHFHLSNGARIERLNWMANPSPVGWDRGVGMMVNYRYDLRTIETNHDRYVDQGLMPMADEIESLLDPRTSDGWRRRRSRPDS